MFITSYPKRLYMLDSARGLAAITITLWHWQHFTRLGEKTPVKIDRTEQPLYEFLKVFYEAGTLGVNFFFILSGFIFFWIYLKKVSAHEIRFKNFLANRLARLYPLYLGTLLLVILLQLLYIEYYGFTFVYGNFDLYHFILSFFSIQTWGFEAGFSFNGPAWAISILLLMYLIFFGLAYFRKANFLVCLIISFTCAILLIVDNNNQLNRYLLRGLTSFFWGGCLFFITHFIINKLAAARPFIYAAAILFWSASLFSIYVKDLTPFILQFGFLGKLFLEGFPVYLLLSATVLSLVLFEITRGPILPQLALLGDISYSVFLLHFPLQLIFALAISYSGIELVIYESLFAFILFFVILLGLSYLTLKKFELPIQNNLRKRLLD